MGNWQTVYKSTHQHQADIVKDVLSNSGIQAIVMNKKDSSYNNWGFFEVNVVPDDVLRAMKIIEVEIKFD